MLITLRGTWDGTLDRGDEVAQARRCRARLDRARSERLARTQRPRDLLTTRGQPPRVALAGAAECLATSRSPSRHDSSFEICEACATPTPDANSRLLAWGCSARNSTHRRARCALRLLSSAGIATRVRIACPVEAWTSSASSSPRLISNATAGEGRYCAATKPLSRPSSPIGGPGQPLTVCEWTIPSTDASAERTPACQVASPRKRPANQIPDTL